MTTRSISTQRPAARASSAKTYLAALGAMLATLLCAMSFVATAPAAAKTLYDISTMTCIAPLSGTDANVYMKLEGTKATSPWLYLNDPGRNEFERYALDHFSFSLNELGTLKSVVVWRNNWGINPSWCLDYVFMKATINNADSYAGMFKPPPGDTWIPSGGTGTRLFPTP